MSLTIKIFMPIPKYSKTLLYCLYSLNLLSIG